MYIYNVNLSICSKVTGKYKCGRCIRSSSEGNFIYVTPIIHTGTLFQFHLPEWVIFFNICNGKPHCVVIHTGTSFQLCKYLLRCFLPNLRLGRALIWRPNCNGYGHGYGAYSWLTGKMLKPPNAVCLLVLGYLLCWKPYYYLMHLVVSSRTMSLQLLE